ncbi:MAG: hypothetical protein VB071_05115 [Lawsonibacter sp.]|nr:hypothetical protein [Lawsonibacter sp.]
MNQKRNIRIRRGLALTMALLLTAGLSTTALADGSSSLPATHDETYYATLDYYGGILDSSVVKSYKTYGNDTITDYGTYDQVTNLTDDLEPSVGDGTVTFQLGADAPSRFYFEGKTTQPLDEFPWKLSLSYTLNGVPTKAEDLAGKSGLVEITLDAVPNPNASEYSRDNLVLTAMSTFNGDDILSLDAQGAQVQLVGNLYCALFMVMPGEEQQFTIRVGSDNFSYDGMVFLAVPATLSQLDQIADLRDAKEKAEDSYDAIQDSLDVVLNSLDGMSGSLNATANGLDQLNRARGTISSGKSQVYDSLDTALDAAGPLTESLKPMASHLTAAQQALTDTTSLLNQMSTNVTELKPEVANTQTILKNLKSDLEDLQEFLDDVEDYPLRGRNIARDLSADFTKLGASMNSLRNTLNSMNNDLGSLKKQVNNLADSDDTQIKIDGMTVAELEAALTQVKQYHAAYEADAAAAAAGMSFRDYLLHGALQQYNAAVEAAGGTAVDMGTFLTTAEGKAASDKADNADALYTASQADGFDEQIEQAKELNELLDAFDLTVTQMKTLVNSLTPNGITVTQQLSDLCTSLGSSYLSGDLEHLSDLMQDMLDEMDDHSGTLSSTTGDLKSAADLALRVSEHVGTALDQIQSLTNIMNTYEPEAQKALDDAKTFSDSASTSISALVNAARSAEDLMKRSGTDLDEGTKQALSGLADALRKSTKGLGQTDTIRNAKDTIDALITDEWDSHAGGDNNILLMDAGAQPVSLTDARNEGTASIQYVMRSQEIKVAEPDEAAQAAAAKKDNGTVWTRIADMFKDIWHTITGWL